MMDLSAGRMELRRPELQDILESGLDRGLVEALAPYGLTPQDAQAAELRVGRAEVVVLGERLVAHTLRTPDAATIKEWIGLGQAAVARALSLPEPPSTPWPAGKAYDPARLSAAEQADLERAAKAYLFGDAGPVAGYKPAIEARFGPFEADVYFVRRLVIEPDGVLIVRGRPTALLVEEIDLHDGGSVRLETVAKMWVQSLRKIGVAAPLAYRQRG